MCKCIKLKEIREWRFENVNYPWPLHYKIRILFHRISDQTHPTERMNIVFFLSAFLLFTGDASSSDFPIDEATIAEIQNAFSQNKLTTTQLLEHYLNKIHFLNPVLKSVLEVNPDARAQAEAADRERLLAGGKALGELHGIPILLKDAIATKDRLNTTAGSFALLGSVVPRDATVVSRLRNAGAVILGKTSLTEWYGSRSLKIPNGWCARGGQAVNPYGKGGDPCGSSSGSAISVAANMVTVSLGTETDGSILCPADYNSVVGIKPTVGLTSRAGVIPISPRQDTIGPICRTVSDAVYVLEAIVGFDPMDCEATKEASQFIPSGGYKQFLRKDGLKGKRLGIVRHPFFDLYPNDSMAIPTFEQHLNLLRKSGATIVDNLQITNVDVILNPFGSGEFIATIAEFKLGINDYLKKLIQSPVRSLADIIAFNNNHPELENMKEYGQDAFLLSEQTDGIGETEKEAISRMMNLSLYGFEEIMKGNSLDAMITLGTGAEGVLAIGGYPAISVPAGYEGNGEPFGILLGGLKGTEPKLIEIAYAYEQATMVRRPPPLLSQLSSL
ncbi:probable amidase At4g34880 [Benincasa hispida]|uniref:probable amidase At4g34880 n=1 Tax=Benincasa hispida TaxID=102211 RepID=UPI0019009F4B|nr:probable amidase At4g34880 [Benincasa hispida]